LLPNLLFNPKVFYSPWGSAHYPSALIAAMTDNTPILYLAPFSAATSPGVAPPVNKTAFMGDFSEAGNPPALVTVRPSFFHLSGNVSVVEVGNIEATWMALPVGQENLLPPPVAGANTEQIQTRNSMPILHQYTEAVIMANALDFFDVVLALGPWGLSNRWISSAIS
jgi:hypothetical protein